MFKCCKLSIIDRWQRATVVKKHHPWLIFPFPHAFSFTINWELSQCGVHDMWRWRKCHKSFIIFRAELFFVSEHVSECEMEIEKEGKFFFWQLINLSLVYQVKWFCLSTRNQYSKLEFILQKSFHVWQSHRNDLDE